MCESSALELGVEFNNGNLNDGKYPAGCYWVGEPAISHPLINFNKITEASSTKPEVFAGRRGVCKAGMDFSIALLYF